MPCRYDGRCVIKAINCATDRNSLEATSIATYILPLHSLVGSTETTKCRQDETYTMPSGLKRLWWKWKSLRLPWRKKWLVGMFLDCSDARRLCLTLHCIHSWQFIGFDTAGNSFWEFKDALNANRLRRIVHYSRKVEYADVKLSREYATVRMRRGYDIDRSFSVLGAMASTHSIRSSHHERTAIRYQAPSSDKTTCSSSGRTMGGSGLIPPSTNPSTST